MHTTIVSVPLTAETHQILVRAARKLARILRSPAAPDVTRLIQHELTGRSVKGLVDEYLDAIGWSIPLRVRPRRTRVRSRRKNSVRTDPRTHRPRL